jgi:molybdate transport system substrate-binding protein
MRIPARFLASFVVSIGAITVGTVLWAQSAAVQHPVLHLICSNGIKGAIGKLLPEYERSSRQHVVVEFGASAVLRRTIEGGAAFDLAILTSAVIDALTQEGKIVPGSTAIAKSNLAVGIRAGAAKTDIGTPTAIQRRLLAAKSITYTKEGASTAAIDNMLKKLGIAEEINAKTVFQTESDRAEESVAKGENELVLAPLSEIVTVPGIEVLGLFPKEFQAPIVMSAGVSAHSANAESARALVKFLSSAAAASAIKASGMEMAAGGK